MTRVQIIASLLLAIAVSGAVWYWRGAMRAEPPALTTGLPASCEELAFEDSAFIVCRVSPLEYDIAVRRTGPDGKPLERLDRLPVRNGFVFAMNAGMYHEDFSPVGLYVEDGKETAPLNTTDALGNFFMKPNGVFFVTKYGKAGVLETAAYAAATPNVAYATQSGPMLVIDGNIHPRFEPDGQSRYIRNGVGVDETGRAVFAISRGEVSLGKFARLYREVLGCRNALFFDGAVSALYDGKRHIVGGKFPVGPSVAVSRKLPPP
ncbi:MAG: phosphodiester glycosidase family protein [Rhizobiaceae bacterium]